jgi:iron complex outermembrane receptor protein
MAQRSIPFLYVVLVGIASTSALAFPGRSFSLPSEHPETTPVKQDQRKKKEAQKEQKKEPEKPPVITEEILVVGEVPRERPISSVTVLDETQIERVKPLDLSESIRYAPGVTVTFGDKSVYTLKLRGVDDKRIAMLVDGIPSYEPYYSSFDLKTFTTDGIDSLQITKGPSSVLYGANTLGGIVNIVTQRPTDEPRLILKGSYGELNTRSLGINTGFRAHRLAVTGGMLYQDSEGYYYPDGTSGKRTKRINSDYQRFNLNGKLYINPNDRSELLFNAGASLSEYAMPPALVGGRPRYWRFKNWDRYTLNAGGFSQVGRHSLARFRAYYTRYDNTLAMYRDPELTETRFESTHNNAVYGFFGLADVYLNAVHQLKFSLDYKGDDVRIQDDVGAPWEEYDQLTLSLGLEDHVTFLDGWQVVAGLSLDYLDKFAGKNTTKLNPLLGLKFTPYSWLDMHASFSRKSRFPSMRALYSPDSGNPDLLSETGTMWELGVTFNREFYLAGSVFLSSFKDLIDSVRLPEYDFRRLYFNIAQARIHGFELQVQKSQDWGAATVNYTFLDHWNEGDDQPLTVLSKHTLNFETRINPLPDARISLFGLWASGSYWLDAASEELLDIPAYFNLDAVLAYTWGRYEVFAKISNIFDRYIYTELGFPWRGRYLEMGFKADIFLPFKPSET